MPTRSALIWAGLAGVGLVVESVLVLVLGIDVRGIDPVGVAAWVVELVVVVLLVVLRRAEPEPVSALRWGSLLTLAGGAAALAIGGNFALFLAMQALPVVVLCAAVFRPLARRTDWVWSSQVRVRLTWTVTGTYAGLIAFSLMQDRRGLPLIHPDVASLVTLGTMFETAVTVAIAVVWLGRREPRQDPAETTR